MSKRFIEHRRHTMRAKPGQHLSQAGVDLARRVGEGIARELPDGGRVLLVSHGGFIEASAVGCLPDLDCRDWGPACNYTEGIRLVFEGDACIAGEVLRVPGTILVN